MTDVNLFRSVRNEQFPNGTIIESQPAPEILYPDFVDKELPNGKIRDADIKSFKGEDGERWVVAGGGTSLFDRENVFTSKGWLSFTIPNGTVIPESLIIRWTDYNKRFTANHYQIESKARTMRMDAFKGALDNLARNAIAKAVELANQNKS